MKAALKISLINLIIFVVIQFVGIEIISALASESDVTRKIAYFIWIIWCLTAFLTITYQGIKSSKIHPRMDFTCPKCQRGFMCYECLDPFKLTHNQQPLCPVCKHYLIRTKK